MSNDYKIIKIGDREKLKLSNKVILSVLFKIRLDNVLNPNDLGSLSRSVELTIKNELYNK